MRAVHRRLALVAALGWSPVIAGGCSAPSVAGADEHATFGAVPYLSFRSENDQLEILLHTAPEQPPARGVNAVLYSVRDAAGAPVDGLDVKVVPWMTAMGHGSSVIPSVYPQGEGQ